MTAPLEKASLETRHGGLPISDGLSYARAEIIRERDGSVVSSYTIEPHQLDSEVERLLDAISVTAAKFDEFVEKVQKNLGSAHASIFVAQKMILLDETLTSEAVAIVRAECVNAEAACLRVLNDFESRLLALEDDYFKDRASDIGEVRNRLLETFVNGSSAVAVSEPEKPHTIEPRILVAAELTPGETVGLDTSTISGLITEKGGAASHAAILARALGIPAVSGIKGAAESIQPGDWVLLNGRTGEIIVNPTPATLNLYPALRKGGIHRPNAVPPVDGLTVLANINTFNDVDAVLDMRAEGIGLYRTEFEFIAADRLLNEDEQYERYARVVEKMGGQPVYIRLLDLGGDKAIRFLNIPKEDNPVLGYRGARLLLGHSELLATQARAIARASQAGPVNVIYPMVVDTQQFYTMKEIFLQNTLDINSGPIRHGVMFEVPSACFCARELFKLADFGSIGSNDLIQYLFAVDRDNDLVAKDFNPESAAFWRLLSQMVEAAREAGKTLSLCGELGGQTEYLPRLIEAGLTTVSVSPRLISLARITARNHLSERELPAW